MMPLTIGIKTPTYDTQQSDKENICPNENHTGNRATSAETKPNSDWAPTVPEWKKMQTKTTSETGWANFVQQYRKVPNKNYESQWREIDGDSTISKAATTISQLVTQEASDILHPNLTQPVQKLTIFRTRVSAICYKIIRIRIEMVIYDTKQKMVERM